MLACVSKQLLYQCRRGNSTQQASSSTPSAMIPEWNNKEETRQSSVVNFRKERKKANHKQLDRAILK